MEPLVNPGLCGESTEAYPQYTPCSDRREGYPCFSFMHGIVLNQMFAKFVPGAAFRALPRAIGTRILHLIARYAQTNSAVPDNPHDKRTHFDFCGAFNIC